MQQMHAGHYIHGKLDFDPMNVNPQCSRCNTYLYGNLADYHVALVSRYGAEAVEELRTRAAQHPGYSVEDLERIIAAKGVVV